MTAAQPRSAQEARMLGYPEMMIRQMFPGEGKDGGLLADMVSGGWDAGKQYPDEPAGGLLAPAEKPKGFWDGGDKFTGKDALAGLLAVISDTASMQRGRDPMAGAMLAGGRMKAADMARKQAEQQQELARMIAIGKANGMTEEQVMAQAMGLDLPEPEKPPTWLKDAQTYASLPDEEKQKVGAFYDISRPYSATTPGGPVFVSRSTIMGGGPSQDGGIQPGTVEDGYRFKGGNPADPNNWEQVGGPAAQAPGAFPVRR